MRTRNVIPGNLGTPLLILAVLAACTPSREPAAPDPEAPAAEPAEPAASDTGIVMAQPMLVPGPATEPAASDPETLAATVADAAWVRNYATLSAHMAEAFSYSFGHEPSRAEALAVFRDEPERLDILVGILGSDCARTTLGEEHWYICPAAAADERQPYYGWRAGFRQRDDGVWEFVWFIAGD